MSGKAARRGPECGAPVPLVDALTRVLRAARRPMARAASAVSGGMGYRDAVVRPECGDRVDRRCDRVVGAALQAVVSHRRDLGRRLAGPRDGLPARQDTLRVRLRRKPDAGWSLHLPHPGSLSLREQRGGTGHLLHSGPGRGSRGRRPIPAPESALATPRGRGHRRRDDRLRGHGRDGRSAAAGLGGRSRHPHPDGRAVPGLHPAAHAVLQHHGRLRADARGAL